MLKQRRTIWTWLALCLAMALAGWSTVHARELDMVTGEHWTNGTVNEKKAFLLGAGTIIEIEQELQQGNSSSKIQSYVPMFIEALSQFTITDIMRALDAYYDTHPEDRKRPVIEVIWSELVLPNLQSK